MSSATAMKIKDSSLHIYEFCKNAKFVDPDYPADITEEVKATLKDMHPSMIIGSGVLGMTVYKVSYSYHTIRGNYREGYKMLFLKEGDPINFLEGFERDIMIEGRMQIYFDNFNFKYPFRAISNVQILDVVQYANAELNIGESYL